MMNFGHFPKGLALLLMPTLQYLDLMIVGHFPKGLALLLVPTLQYYRYDEFWVFVKGVSLAFDANFIIFSI